MTPTQPGTPGPGPRPADITTPEVAQSKRDLTSWWRTFKRGNPAKLQENQGMRPFIALPILSLYLLYFYRRYAFIAMPVHALRITRPLGNATSPVS